MGEEIQLSCPYCGETNIMEFFYMHDNEQSLIEDCIVCCRPMEIFVRKDSEGNIFVEVKNDEGF